MSQLFKGMFPVLSAKRYKKREKGEPTHEPLQGEGVGVVTCSHEPIILFWFYPLFFINNTTCSLKCLKVMFSWSQNLLHIPLIPQNTGICHFSTYLSACFTFLFIIKKSPFPCGFFSSLESAHAVLHGLQFQSSSCFCDSDDIIGMLKKHNSKINITFEL